MKRFVPLLALAAAACSTIPDLPAPVLAGQFAIDQVTGAAIPTGAPINIAFDGQRVSGQSGCNRFASAVSHGPSTLTFGPVAGTRMACVDPARAELERAFLALMPQLTRWRLEGDRLTLSTADGRVVSGVRSAG